VGVDERGRLGRRARGRRGAARERVRRERGKALGERAVGGVEARWRGRSLVVEAQRPEALRTAQQRNDEPRALRVRAGVHRDAAPQRLARRAAVERRDVAERIAGAAACEDREAAPLRIEYADHHVLRAERERGRRGELL